MTSFGKTVDDFKIERGKLIRINHYFTLHTCYNLSQNVTLSIFVFLHWSLLRVEGAGNPQGFLAAQPPEQITSQYSSCDPSSISDSTEHPPE